MNPDSYEDVEGDNHTDPTSPSSRENAAATKFRTDKTAVEKYQHQCPLEYSEKHADAHMRPKKNHRVLQIL